ncbi:unnamed protein product [Trichogramma brassicae]|uniref:Uncharacterized protein n=1 Tax=Trichogramma brassicae TaxID=86971 RepID=A0A6H5IEH7_9HYME|nr:unnamed protein product [Trichogramma brassicae]
MLADAYGTTPLHELCKREAMYGDDDESALDLFFRICSEKVVNVDAEDEEGRRPLHFALGNGKKITADRLLAMGADPESHDTRGSTPLHAIASYHGHRLGEDFAKDVVSLIDEWGLGSVRARDADGNEPLHLAARSANRVLVDWLLRNGADPNAVNAVGSSPLHLALMSSSDRRLMEALLKHGADPNSINESGKTPLILICDKYGNRMETVQEFFEINDAMNNHVHLDATTAEASRSSAALHMALARQNKSLFKYLLRRGAPIPTWGIGI